jgi:hypothetical protein
VLCTTSAAAIAAAELYEEQQRTREDTARANQQARYLSEAGAALANSLDYEATLRGRDLVRAHRRLVRRRHARRARTTAASRSRTSIRKVRHRETFRERLPDKPDTPGTIAAPIHTASR